MNIAHFTNAYLPLISGVVRSVSSFRKALTDLGHNVFVFAQNQPDYEDKEPFIFRYPSLDLGLPGDFPATIPVSNFIDRLLPPLKLEVIHSHHPVLLGQAAASKAEKLKLPLVFTFHTRYREYSHYFPLSQEFIQDFVRDVIETWLADYMRRCHQIVVPSEGMKQILMDQYGVRSGMSVIPTGIDVEVYQSANGERIRRQHGWQDDILLISVGRLAKEKNFSVLISAFKQVVNCHPNARLIILGDGDERQALERYAHDAEVGERVHFLGKVAFEQVPSYLRAADLFCFSSVTETQGLVTLEAMAAGLPVVATDATGTRDVIDNGVQGLLTDNNRDALGDAICRILDDSQLKAHMSQAALDKARTLDIHESAKRLLEVYEIAKDAQRSGRMVQVADVAGSRT